MMLIIKLFDGTKFQLNVEKTSTVLYIKEKIQEIKNINVKMQRLLFQGMPMVNESKIAKYNMNDNSVIHLILNMM